jgi:hypothetical protein
MDSRRRSTNWAATAVASLFALTASAEALADGDPPVVTSIPSGPYTVGNEYYSTNSWVEYHAGNLPVIISAPHGGHLTPSSIPNRTSSSCSGSFVTVTDTNTAQLARSLKYRFHEYTGRYPHVIINRVKRTKVDTNRNKADGACGNSNAGIVWEDFHSFIQVAKNKALNSAWNKGWYIDVHGHSGSKQLLGYRLSSANLRESNATLNSDPYYRNKSTFRTFATNSPFTFGSALLRGNKAIGTELGRAGYLSIPSKQDYAPYVGEKYFQGGYNVNRHGCNSGGNICGLQVETPSPGVRDTQANRAAYAEALVRATDVFLGHNFEFSLWSSKGEIVVDNYNPANDSSKAVFEASSNWGTYTDNSGKYLSNFRRTNGNGPENDWAAFKFKVPASGSYSVYARWPANSNRSTSVRYRVFETIGGTMFFNGNRNQQINGGKWNKLGTWSWSSGGWGQVIISRSLSGSGQLAADAIRVVRN